MLYFQLVIMAGTVMLAYYFECTDTFSVHVQGFFCYDTSYTKPYLGPEDRSAVPPPLLYALVAGLPTLLPPGRGSTVMGGGIVTVALSAPVRANRKWDKCPEGVTAPAFGDQPPLPFLEQSQCVETGGCRTGSRFRITVTETVLFLVQYTSKEFDRSEKTVATGDCCYLNPLVRRTFRFLGVYSFGLFTVDIFVNAGQVVTGNLAPYFLTVCKPNYTVLGCQQALRYISHQEACSGNQEDILRARKTFPCKEAALSLYAALYLAMYVTLTVQAKGTRSGQAGPVSGSGVSGLPDRAEPGRRVPEPLGGRHRRVHNRRSHRYLPGKLLLGEESPEHQPGSALLTLGRMESPLEKYIASQTPQKLNHHSQSSVSLQICQTEYSSSHSSTCSRGLIQETDDDDEDEESCYIKERLLVFLNWLQGLHWFQRISNRRWSEL
ncbi:Phospholipid phosphatase-related protein type 5 [Dissostichus eleginoides]|uniref:Phospholipid phosphatase-related protein type 5 n=1 Tax=Dissostichus eleginoides TaxID=100907 RepID=A0AAD9BNI9_DISEL|nr:Phospholipid phosphatase-related protein type 5 [Dissostichus eleginoides]